MKRLLKSERLALVVFAVLLATTFLWAPLYRAFSFLAELGILIVWLIVGLIALFHIGFAFRDPHPTLAHRLRAAAAVPFAILLFMAIDSWLAPGPRITASIHLATHREEMERAERQAGPGRPAAIRYLVGVPDGGSVIVRSRTNPSRLPVSEQRRLTNERIRGCRTIFGNAWLCSFN